MFQVDTRPWYLETHPEVPDSFLCLSQIAHDETWRKAAADYLKAVIRHCEEKYGDRIYGYFILGGGTTEWLSDHDHEEPHPIKEAAYKKYRNDAGATLPTKEELEKDGRVFLEPEEENVLCERRFHADTIADLVLYFAAEVQSVIRHQKLLGLYYGYLMELGAPRLYNAGHLGYEKVFFSDDIDMISSPSAYRYRELTDPSAFMVTQKTLDAHNKLYFLEFDHITHVAPSMVEEAPSGNSRNGTLKIIPGAEKRCNNESESLNLMYRDFLLCYANATALWWFDMFDGWFRSEGMMNAVQRMIALHGELINLSKESVAQIAVYAEGEALYHVRKSAKLANESLSKMLRTFAEMGAPYDIYSVGDLDACSPERYRMILLIDEFDIPQKRMETIRRLQREGVTVVWFMRRITPTGRKTTSGGLPVPRESACRSPGSPTVGWSLTARLRKTCLRRRISRWRMKKPCRSGSLRTVLLPLPEMRTKRYFTRQFRIFRRRCSVRSWTARGSSVTAGIPTFIPM